MHTSGRALRQASTQRPCAARRASDTHVQVGPNQEFAFKWATGHGGFTWVILIKGSDYDWLGHRDFQKFVDDYIANAPNGTDTSRTVKGKRYHGSRAALDNMIGSHFKLNVSAKTVYHPETDAFKFMYDYTDLKLANDYRVAYKSPKYPWLMMVGKFAHNVDRPGDNDGINLSIPAGTTAGHYIAHWRWSGYYDCVDIDYRTVAVNNTMIYGQGAGNFLFDRIDHCSVVDPQLAVTPFISASDGIESCLNALPRGNGNSIGQGAPTQRIAMQVLPTTMPSIVPPAFRAELGIPDSENIASVLYQSPWLQLNGIDTRSPDNWAAFNAKTTVAVNTTCTGVLMTITTTYRDAVIRCGVNTCTGVSYAAGTLVTDPTAVASFKLCKDTIPKVDPKSVVAWKPSVPDPKPAVSTPVSISFSQAKDSIPADPKYLSDVGLEFSLKGGYKYGWLCNITASTYGMFYETKTAERSCISMPYQLCPNAPQVGGLPARNLWEIEVPNGVYNVSFLFINYGTPLNCTTPGCRDIDTSTCAIENTYVKQSQFLNKIVDTNEVTVQVEVTDSRLTLSGSYQYYGRNPRVMCRNLATLTFQRVADSLPSVWFPSSSNPWFQTALASPAKVGYVYLTSPTTKSLDTPGSLASWPAPYAPTFSNCDSWHLFKSDRCYGNSPIDLFAAAAEGATVGVSNTPCSGTSCGGTVCGRIQISWTTNIHEAATGVRGRNVFGRPFVNCNGLVGKYLWVQLPGANRILNVIPMFTTPDIPQNSLLCYGAIPRYPTELEPEYIISNDPEDPVFYSTCYMREFDKTWQYPLKSDISKQTWRFSGRCIDCPSYRNADSNFTTAPLGVAQPPVWTTTDRCMNCDYNQKVVAEPLRLVNVSATCNSTSTATVTNPAYTDCLQELQTEDGRLVSSEGQCSVVTRRSSKQGCSSTFVYAANLCQCYLAKCGTCKVVRSTTAAVYMLN